jgi:hypothetical protein
MLKAGARYNGLDLSEQYLIDCGYNGASMNGCNGAHTDAYGPFFASTLNGQSPHEFNYPYLNRNPNLACPSNTTTYNSGAYVQTPLVDSFCNENKLMTLVSTYGAAMTAIYASDPGFKNYASGVFSGCTSTTVNHGVMVVGYGTDAASGMDYWLIRNSWDTTWGLNGYVKIARGTGQCGIGQFCYAAACAATSGPLSDVPIVPPPPPIPASQTCDLSKKWPSLTGRFTMTNNGFTSAITCTNGICTPTNPGPSNACMYICGQLSC